MMDTWTTIFLILLLVGACFIGYAFYRSHRATKHNKEVAARLAKLNGMVEIKLDALKNARARGTHV